MKSGAIAAGATAVLGAVGRPIEKITNFDFKENIQAVRDAANLMGVSPKLIGDFTGRDATRAAETLSKSRGGGALPRLKENVNELSSAAGNIENMFTKGTVYSGEAGKNIVKAVQANYKEATTEGNRLYGVLDRVAQQNNLTKLNPTETRATLQNVLSDYSDLFKTLERPALEAKLGAMSGKVSAQEVKQQAGLVVNESGIPFIPEIKGLAEFTFKDIRSTAEEGQERIGDLYSRSQEGEDVMNWEVIWTAVGLLTTGLFFAPFYIALAIAYEKSRSKVHLEFVATANAVEKKVKFDEAVERLFEEGEAR